MPPVRPVQGSQTKEGFTSDAGSCYKATQSTTVNPVSPIQAEAANLLIAVRKLVEMFTQKVRESK